MENKTSNIYHLKKIMDLHIYLNTGDTLTPYHISTKSEQVI